MSSVPTALSLAGLFTDHLVLQRGRPSPIWGCDRPGQRVTLEVAGQPPVSTVAGPDGAWRLDCPELPAGGPYRISVRGSSERLLEDVLVGEVWLCSGQSNMELPLAAIDDSNREIAAADCPAIRLFDVTDAAAPEPAASVDGEWRVCTRESADAFSAIGYCFAREIHRRLGVPVGILSSSWGGTPIEAWTSAEALRSVPGFDAELARLAALERDAPRLRAVHQEQVLAWERDALPADPGNTGEALGWASPAFDDGAWPTMAAPGYWQAQGLRHNGVVWFRRTVDIPAEWAGQDLLLGLGAIDDFDVTYFGGAQVGAHPKGTPAAYRMRRRYVVPGSRVKAGRAVIAVRIFDHFGNGGFVGPRQAMCLARGGHESERLELSGDWRYQVEHAIPLVPGEVWQSYPPAGVPEPHHYPAALYNGMIAPLIPYALRGALWYQGESNADRHARYRDHQIAMIRDWRARWKIGQFPFYFVQLAGYGTSPTWPYLREAQGQTLIEPATGMAVAIDVGDRDDIHPRNKQAVGHRLALIALAHAYGERVACSGPTLDRVEIVGDRACVHLRHATGLVTRDGRPEVMGFELAGADRQYHPADARIEGETVLVTSPDVPEPCTVRYAWADYLETNLENAAGLPAVPFRTDGYR
jgi:sialate O-acetylesterase